MKATLPIGVAILLAVLGVGAAALVNQVGVRYALALPEGGTVLKLGVTPKPALVDGATPAPKPSTRQVRSRSDYIEMIVGQNLFDHESIGKVSEDSDDDAEESDLKFELLATMVASPALFSTALLVPEGKEDASPDAYGLGDRLGDAEIIAIGKWEIRIRRTDGKEEVLKLKQDLDDPKPAGRNTKAASNDDDDDGQIRKTGANSWEIDRELVDKHLTDLAGISRLGRAIPHRGADGQIDGYRLSGIRRGTPGQKLGLRNGDIIHGVNGMSLASTSEAMSAFQSLQSESNLKFEVTRRGKKQTNSYTVR